MNLTELAKLCGCSPATVSKALRNSAGVNPNTKERIMAAAKANGIAISAEQLLHGRTVLACVSTFNNESSSRLLSYLRLAFEEMGVSLIACSWEFNRDMLYELPRIARSISNLSGILVLNTISKDECTAMDDFGVPVVSSGDSDDRDSIFTDFSSGYHRAVNHLITHGRRRIAFAGEQLTTRKEACFRQALLDHGIELDERLIYRSSTYSTKAGAEGFAALMAQENPPDAIICAYDYIALGVLNSAEAAGLTVPDELAVIGADDIKAAAAYRLGLTTLAANINQYVEALIGLLLRRIREPDAPPQKIVLPFELIVRGTA